MSTSIRPRRSLRPLAALGVVPLAFLLSGCLGIPGLPGPAGPGGSGEDPNVDELVEDIVEGADGDIDFESGSLPADFPEGEIPLVPGDIGPSMSISDGAAWSVTIYAADEATANTAPDLLEAAGFSNESQIFWENEAYVVVIVGIQQDDEGRWAVSYQVQTQ